MKRILLIGVWCIVISGCFAIGWMACGALRRNPQNQDLPTIEEIQQRLVDKGYNLGEKGVDGRMGKDTLKAWELATCDREASRWDYLYN